VNATRDPAMAQFKPQTRMGRVACWLALGFVAWWSVNMALFWLGLAELPSGANRPAIMALAWLGMACGVATAVTAVLAVTRHRDRGVAVFLCLAPGLFAVAFLLGELLIPH
jgi:uncharacterized membrane protein YhaH (DUF805 family)